MMNTPSHSEFRFTGKHMLAIMIAFFGVIIAVNFTMAFLAASSWTGLVVKNSYVASQNYNKNLEIAREQRARGWRSTLGYRNGSMSFTLVDRDGHDLQAGEFVATIGRPAFEQEDDAVRLDYVAEGRYAADLFLAPGIWTVQINGSVSGLEYRRDVRILISENGEGRLQ